MVSAFEKVSRSANDHDDYFAELIAAMPKVRVATGEGDTLNKALETVRSLPPAELPLLPGIPSPPLRWRKVAALHREMSRRCGGNKYFLSCRDTAKIDPQLSYQAASNINAALEQLRL